MKKIIHICLGLVLSAVCLWLSFRHVEMDAMLAQTTHMPLKNIIIFCVSIALMQLCRVVRWHILTRDLAPIGLWEQARISLVGGALLLLLPVRMGELGRPYLFKKVTQVPITSTLAVTAIERTMDGLWVALLFFVSTALLPLSRPMPPLLQNAAIGVLALFISLLVCLILLATQHTRMLRWNHTYLLPRNIGLSAQLDRILLALAKGLKTIPSRQVFGITLLMTISYWVFNVVAFQSIIYGFGWQLPFWASTLLVCIVVLGVMVPAGPGFIGPFQGAILLGLSIFNLDATQAAAYSLIVYPLTVLVILCMALPFLLVKPSEQPNTAITLDSNLEPQSPKGVTS